MRVSKSIAKSRSKNFKYKPPWNTEKQSHFAVSIQVFFLKQPQKNDAQNINNEITEGEDGWQIVNIALNWGCSISIHLTGQQV